MGWAGPAQPTGPDSAPKVLGRSQPKMDWADLGPTKSDILFWARPGPEGRAGPGPTWSSNNTGGGNYFPPTLLHAERYSFCMQGTKQNATMKGEEELPGAEEAVCRWSVGFAGGAAVEAGGGVVTHGRRFQTTATVSNVQRCYCFFFPTRFQLFLPLPILQSLFLPFPLGFPNGFLCFGSLSLNPIPFFFFLLFLSSLRSLLSGLSPPSSRSISQRSWVLFIEPRAWLFLMGSSRLVGHWARLPRFGSTRFSSRSVVGQCVRSVGSRRERDRQNSNKSPFFPSSPLQCSGGKKKEEQCHSKRHRSALSFFFF